MKLKCSAFAAALIVVGFTFASAQSPAPEKKTNDIKPEAMELLRRVIAEQQKNPDKIIRVPSSTNVVTKAELEKQYLAGQLTARQYQKALDQLGKDEQKRTAEIEKQRKREAQHSAKTNAQAAARAAAVPAPTNSPKPVAVTTPTNAPAELTPEQKKLADVEARIDAMMRQKAEREKAAASTATNNAAKAPQTKRERLNTLLKQMIDGKISEADYNAQRNKIVAEPD